MKFVHVENQLLATCSAANKEKKNETKNTMIARRSWRLGNCQHLVKCLLVSVWKEKAKKNRSFKMYHLLMRFFSVLLFLPFYEHFDLLFYWAFTDTHIFENTTRFSFIFFARCTHKTVKNSWISIDNEKNCKRRYKNSAQWGRPTENV